MASIIKQPRVSLIYNRYGYASATRDHVIEVRVSWKKKQKYISTGIRVFPKQWSKRQQLIINRLDAAILNRTLDKLVSDIRAVLYDMYEEGREDIFAIPARLEQRRKRNEQTFLDYYAEKAELRKYGIGKTAQGRYDIVLRVLKEWKKITYFSDLTSKNIIALDKYLEKKGIQATSRWHNYHKYIKRFLPAAIRDGFLTSDPYDGVRLDHGNYDRSIEKCLTVDELKQLREAKMPNERLVRVRDLFVFQCYTCLSYKDLAGFDKNLITVENGRKIYYDHRKKSGVRLCFPLLTPALEILERYNGLPPLSTKGKTTGKILGNISYNKYLKEISGPAGLSQRLTTHWARHTGASILLNAGVSPEVIAVVGGWANTKVLMKIYARMQDKTVVQAVNEIEHKIV